MEDTAEWSATGLENQGSPWARGSIPLSSAWEVGEAGAHVPLKTARWQFDPVTSHSLPYSSMAEQPAVNGKVAGSSPAGAAIHCRVDNMESRCDSESRRCWFDPSLGIQSYWEVRKQEKRLDFESSG